MASYTVLCSHCNHPVKITGDPQEKRLVHCSRCKKKSSVLVSAEDLEEIAFYALERPFSYASLVKDTKTLKKQYLVLEPQLAEDEQKVLDFLQKQIITSLSVRFDTAGSNAEKILFDTFNKLLKTHEITVDSLLQKKLFYYIRREFLGFGKIEPLMRDPHIEDISCDGEQTPLFVVQRDQGSIETNIVFDTEDELSRFVVKLAQKCGKHISVADPMLDATMPDGSRIQMTLSSEITTKGSTFTIRKFRADPITPVDLIEYNTLSPQLLAFLWLAVEHGYNALIAGGTAAGKTSTLNALALFIPRESKIVSIEETREINLPHPNWIPGITRSGFGEIVNDRMVGEIDLFDLMKAALRQRPEYILVGEIRGKEAYVLFQAMATGHTTYSTVHADSVKALVHRLEGKPINIPRSMMQSLDIVLIQASVKFEGKQVRRVRQIVELLSVDAETQEVLTNMAFTWGSSDDSFAYSGKSYILEQIRTQLDMTADEMLEEVNQRKKILEWMHKYDIREFIDVAKIVTAYTENPDELVHEIKMNPEKAARSSLVDSIDETESLQQENEIEKEGNASLSADQSEKKMFSSVKNLFSTRKKKKKNPSKGG